MDSDLLFSPVIITSLVGSITVLLVFILFRFVRQPAMGRKKKSNSSSQSNGSNSGMQSDQVASKLESPSSTKTESSERFTPPEIASNKETPLENSTVTVTDDQDDEFQLAKTKKRNKPKKDSLVEEAPKENSPIKVNAPVPPSSSSSSQILEESQKRINELTNEVTRLKSLINQERSDKDDEVGSLKRKLSELERKLLSVATDNAVKTDYQEKCVRMERQITAMQAECNKALAEKSAMEEKIKTSEKVSGNDSLLRKDYELQFLRKERDDALQRVDQLSTQFNATLQANVKTSADIRHELDIKEQSTKELEAKLQQLSQEIDEQREKNNTLRERNWMLMEQVKEKPESPAKGPEQPAGKKSRNQNRRKTSENSISEDTKALEAKLKAALDSEKKISANLKAAEDNIVKLNDTITQLNCKVSLLQKENSLLTRDKQNLETRLAKKSPGQSQNGPNIPLMEKEIADLKKLNSELTGKNSQLEEAMRRSPGQGGDEMNRLRSRAEESEQESRQLKSRLHNMDSERARLEHVLRNTEDTLCRLQVAVDEEETRWKQALEDSNGENQKIKEELVKAKSEIDRLSGGSEKSEKMAELQQLLDKVSEERDKAMAHLKKANTSQVVTATPHPVEASSSDIQSNDSNNSVASKPQTDDSSTAKPKPTNENKLLL